MKRWVRWYPVPKHQVIPRPLNSNDVDQPTLRVSPTLNALKDMIQMDKNRRAGKYGNGVMNDRQPSANRQWDVDLLLSKWIYNVLSKSS